MYSYIMSLKDLFLRYEIFPMENRNSDSKELRQENRTQGQVNCHLSEEISSC